MTSQQKELLINKICSGISILKRGKKSYVFRAPSAQLKYKASLKYQIELSRLETVFGQEELLPYISGWNDKLQEEIDIHIPKVLDDIRLDIYLATVNDPNYLPRLNEKMGKVKERLIELLSLKHKYDDYTAEGMAERARVLFLIERCVKRITIAPDELLPSYYEQMISDSSVREIARSNEWAVKWIAMKKGIKVFEGNLTDDQERLIRWTTLYENIMESQEPPPDKVFDNDDAFDGYIIWKKKESERLKLADEFEKRIGDKARGGSCEVYLPARNQEEIERIHLMNSPDAMRIKENRFKQIEKMGVVKQGQLQDERIKIEMAINRMAK